MLFRQKSLFKYFAIALLAFLTACSSKDTVNEAFAKKYAKDIAQINSARRVGTREMNEKMTSFAMPTADDITRQRVKNRGGYYAYVDIKKFGARTPRNYFPNAEVYQKSEVFNPTKRLPEDMFYLSYNTDLYPPFSRSGLEFDNIKVPNKDVYGVKTELAEKQYLLAGNGAIQKTVDDIHSKRKKEDVEFSKILIKEQKRLRRREKMIKIIGSDNFLKVVPASDRGAN